MATFLQLCNRVASDSGTVTGESSFSTVVGATGRLAKIKRWTNEAYRQIQNAHRNWGWMRGQFTSASAIVSGTASYAGTSFNDVKTAAAATRFSAFLTSGKRDEDRYKIYLTSAGVATAGRLRFLPWEDFYAARMNTGADNNFPAFFSIDPEDGKIVLSPTPDAAYTVLGPYRKSAQDLALDADIPEMPIDFHDLIVTFAQKLLLTHDEGPGATIALWEFRKNSDFVRLEQEQLPQWGFGGPIA